MGVGLYSIRTAEKHLETLLGQWQLHPWAVQSWKECHRRKSARHVEMTSEFVVTVEVMDVILAIFVLVRHKFQVSLKLTEEVIT